MEFLIRLYKPSWMAQLMTSSGPKINLRTAIALSKFELENWSKTQNVGYWTGYQRFKFQFHIQISKFWQVRNLRLPFHYLPKFTFCHICWFNGLSVCLSVCPSLYKITDNSRTLWDIFPKISPQVAAPSLFLSRSKVKGQGHEVTAKVKIRNHRKSVNFWATAKFKKKHNVVLLKAHLYDIIKFRYPFRFKRSPEVENRKCEIAISIFVSFQYSSNLIAYLETTCPI